METLEYCINEWNVFELLRMCHTDNPIGIAGASN